MAASGFASSPAWSPDGSTIAVAVTDPGVRNEVEVLDTGDGSQVATVAKATSPSWTADGRLLAYAQAPGVSDASGLWRVAEFVPDGHRGFATGLPVPGIDPVGYLYTDYRVSAAPCAIGDGPLTAGVEPVDTITVTAPVDQSTVPT